MKSHCSDCGWEKVIARTFMKGRREVNLCMECAKSRERMAMPGAKMTKEPAAPKRVGFSRDQMTWLTLGILMGVAIGFNIAWYLWSLAL